MRHGSFGEEQSVEFAALHHKSLLPVSRINRKLCPGVPTVRLQKYSVSYRDVSTMAYILMSDLPHCLSVARLYGLVFASFGPLLQGLESHCDGYLTQQLMVNHFVEASKPTLSIL